jgi:hypothetical protein
VQRWFGDPAPRDSVPGWRSAKDGIARCVLFIGGASAFLRLALVLDGLKGLGDNTHRLFEYVFFVLGFCN